MLQMPFNYEHITNILVSKIIPYIYLKLPFGKSFFTEIMFSDKESCYTIFISRIDC